jgi:hypothetical protein
MRREGEENKTMSMIANYMIVEEELIGKIQSGEVAITDVLYESDVDEKDQLDTDKAWQAIHFLLCGDPWEGEGPLVNVVLGGTEINAEDIGYGPARFLTATEVKETYEAFKDITSEDLKQKFDVQAMQEYEIYPGYADEEDFAYVSVYYEEVKKIYKRATESGKAMLLYVN